MNAVTKYILSIAFFCVFTWSGVAHAQTNESLAPDITISRYPLTSIPGQSVSIELSSYGTDLSQTFITWKVGGVTTLSGIGKTKITTTTPQKGVSIVTATVSGYGVTSPTTVTLTLQGSGVDLLWEAPGSYTPPFYKGKPLATLSGLIQITAVSPTSAPKNLSYEWARNDSVDQGASGYNKNSFLFKQDILKSQEAVRVTAYNGGFSSTAQQVIVPTAPEIAAYIKREGFVDFSNGFSDVVRTTDPGVTFRFEPYFFSVPSSTTKDLVFEIQDSNTTLTDPTNQNEVSLTAPEEKGESVITTTIRTVKYSLQNATQKLRVIFE